MEELGDILEMISEIISEMISEIISGVISESFDNSMEFWLMWVSALWLVLLVIVGLGVLLVNKSYGVLIGVSHGAHRPSQCQAS